MPGHGFHTHRPHDHELARIAQQGGGGAHLLPIFGVRGANTGLQDAQDLACKLGATL